MEVIKSNNGTLSKVQYPRADREHVIGLAPEIEYYEIKVMPKPTEYDPDKHNIAEIWTLTETQGEFLRVCLIEWQLTDKPQAEVLADFNTSFGTFIDNAYPLWERVKDYSYPSDAGTLRQAQESALRAERQAREDAYMNENIFPDFNFQWL